MTIEEFHEADYVAEFIESRASEKTIKEQVSSGTAAKAPGAAEAR